MAVASPSSGLTPNLNMTEIQILINLPNPFTPMAFLPPELAWQVTVATYWIVGSLAVLIWDIVSNLHNDFALLMKYRINLSMVFYCISRISCLTYLTFLTVLQTAPVGNCELIRRIQVLYAIAIPSTSLLFFVRVCALYYNNKFVAAFFFLSWLGVVAGCITPTQGVRAMRIGISDYCINGKLDGYVALAGLLPLINDTLVFCATSFALLRNSQVDGVQASFKVLLFGKYLPVFSKAILHDGQVYYLATIGLNLTTVVMIYAPGLPVVYANFLGVPNIVLTNILACLVYRKVRFGIFRETAANPNISKTLANSDREATPTPRRSFKSNSRTSGSRSIQIFTTKYEEHDHQNEQKIQMEELHETRSDVDADVERCSKKHDESIGLAV